MQVLSGAQFCIGFVSDALAERDFQVQQMSGILLNDPKDDGDKDK